MKCQMLLPIALSLPLVLLMAGCATTAPAKKITAIESDAQATGKRFVAKVYKNDKGETLNYRFLKPRRVLPLKKYPLVLFMHGAGERGADNTAQLKHGCSQFASDAVMKGYPCYVIAPQVPAEGWWTDRQFLRVNGTAPEPSLQLRLALELIDRVCNEYRIDRDRIYVTGLSMGGFGTWDALWRRPELFAAAAPICGGGDTSKAPIFAKTPIWCFHGGADKTVPVQRSRDMVEAVKKAGGSPKYSEYPGVGHDSWTQTYQNPDFWAWMFAQHR